MMLLMVQTRFTMITSETSRTITLEWSLTFTSTTPTRTYSYTDIHTYIHTYRCSDMTLHC